MNKFLKPFFAVFFLTASFVTSQSYAQYVTIGPKAGVNFSRLSNLEEVDHINNPNFGVFAIYSNISHWGVSAEVVTTRTGYRMDLGTSVSSTRIDYIHVPIMANYFFNDYDARIRPKLLAGPYASFIYDTNVTGENVPTDFQAIDAGLVVGGGVNIEITNGVWLNTDLRYTQGLIDVIQDATGNQLTQNLSLNIGVGIGL